MNQSVPSPPGSKRPPAFDLAHLELFDAYRKAIFDHEKAKRAYACAMTGTEKQSATTRFRRAQVRVSALRTEVEQTFREEARAS